MWHKIIQLVYNFGYYATSHALLENMIESVFRQDRAQAWHWNAYSAHSHLSSNLRINTVSEALFLILIVTTIHKKNQKNDDYTMNWCTDRTRHS